MSYRVDKTTQQLLLLLIILLSIPCLSGQDTVEQLEPIRVNVNLVSLRFTIRNQQGEFLNTLTEDDIRVYENSERQQVAFFEQPRVDNRVQEPLWLAFLLDVSGSTFSTRAEEIMAARAFLENVHSITQVGIYGFTDHLIPFHVEPNRFWELKSWDRLRIPKPFARIVIKFGTPFYVPEDYAEEEYLRRLQNQMDDLIRECGRYF